MSTYLMAFLIAEYDVVTQNIPDYNILVEIAARPEAINNNEGDFALNETVYVTQYFIEYFDVPYPLPKSSKLF